MQQSYCTFRKVSHYVFLKFYVLLKVIGQYIINISRVEVWIESGLYGNVTVAAIFNGKKQNKCIRAHKLTYESLLHIFIFLFEKWFTHCNSNDYIHTLNRSRLTALQISEDISKSHSFQVGYQQLLSTLTTLSELFEQYVHAQGPTFKYWFTYINFVPIFVQ